MVFGFNRILHHYNVNQRIQAFRPVIAQIIDTEVMKHMINVILENGHLITADSPEV